ncbi:hypothetical protein C0J52_17163 [Blattella germanica]|nr:hypothetical protein C0J52_17163 [Blattella germanica]
MISWRRTVESRYGKHSVRVCGSEGYHTAVEPEGVQLGVGVHSSESTYSCHTAARGSGIEMKNKTHIMFWRSGIAPCACLSVCV